MATKKRARTIVKKTSKADALPSKGAVEETRRQAIKHEAAGHWSQATKAWANVERLAATKRAREEAAGRKAAADVRAQAKTGKTVSLADTEELVDKRDETLDDITDGAKPERKVTAGSELAAPREPDPRLPPVGTILTKTDRYESERARCTIVEGGVEYGGQVYKSLSAAAMAAAKDLGLGSKTMNGFTFWGITKPHRRERDVLAVLARAFARYQEITTAVVKTADDEQRAKVHEALNQHASAVLALAGETAQEAVRGD